MTAMQAIPEDDVTWHVSIGESTSAASPVPVPPAEPELPVAERIRAELADFTARVILARQLTLGTSSVLSHRLCNDGVYNFMTRGHLYPIRVVHGNNRHPVDETREQAAAAEAQIRTWCAGHIGGEIEEFTDAGLARRLPMLQLAHQNWRTAFLQLISTRTLPTTSSALAGTRCCRCSAWFRLSPGCACSST